MIASKPASGCLQASLFVFFSSSLAPHSNRGRTDAKPFHKNHPFDEDLYSCNIHAHWVLVFIYFNTRTTRTVVTLMLLWWCWDTLHMLPLTVWAFGIPPKKSGLLSTKTPDVAALVW